MGKTKNDTKWELIFEDFKVIEIVKKQGYFIITSTQINKYREARLMTKFDHQAQRPELFVKYNLSILPISRGSYIIGNFDTFHDFNDDDIEITKIIFPSSIESINHREITSEATAINCAFVSKILQDFTGENNLQPTVSGRMSSKTFDFTINTNNAPLKIEVENSQIEIDGGYEGDNSLNLIEAKNYISNDFLIRQLFYPYQLWNNKISKKVRPIFLTYSNGFFDLREFAFENPKHYNSLTLIKHKKYYLQDAEENAIVLNVEFIETILNSVLIIDETKLPFPQANSMERIINLCELLNENEFISKENITQNYDFNSRQTDYYLNAGKYLGLVSDYKKDEELGGVLTENGNNIFNLSIKERQIEFIKAILSHKVYNEVLKRYFENGEMPSKNEIVIIMKVSNLHNVKSDVTFFRRSSTILSWINWIIKQIEVE